MRLLRTRRVDEIEVPDPYYGGPEAFDEVLDIVEEGCRALLADIEADDRRLNELPTALAKALRAQLESAVVSSRPVAGGDINDGWRVELGRVSWRSSSRGPGAHAADFEAEAAGLAWLAEAGAVTIPTVLGHGSDPPWLAVEWIERGSLSPAGAEELGRRLAVLHRSGADAHGVLPPGSPDARLRIGSLELALEPAGSWADLYREQLIAPLVRGALELGRINEDGAEAITDVAARLESICPEEPPARLHGDLWSGNVLPDSSGRAWLIDPAAYGGHREIDLAMLRLFGAPSERIFDSYEEALPLTEGYTERIELFQLLPLLVHAVLFGGHYGGAAHAAARKYL